MVEAAVIFSVPPRVSEALSVLSALLSSLLPPSLFSGLASGVRNGSAGGGTVVCGWAHVHLRGQCGCVTCADR